MKTCLISALSCFVLASLVGCGGAAPSSTTSPTPAPAAAGAGLTGNWLLSGALPATATSTVPVVALSLDVQNGVLTGMLSYRVQCSSPTNGPVLVGSSAFSVPVSGVVASDGSFSAGPAVQTALVATVTGVAPSAAGLPWRGSVTLAVPSGPACLPAGAVAFTATPVGDVTGVYGGTLANGTVLAGPGGTGPATPTKSGPISLTLLLHQGGTLYQSAARGGPLQTHLALTGSVQIAGLPCFSKGTMSTSLVSEVGGSDVVLNFLMDDGSVLEAQASIADTAAGSLAVQQFSVQGGQCSGLYDFLLTNDPPLRRQ